ncbi:AlpA family phage regulatory protein [Pseudomonas sp. McL0111]
MRPSSACFERLHTSFSKQVRIGPNSVAWRQSVIAKWMFDLDPCS